MQEVFTYVPSAVTLAELRNYEAKIEEVWFMEFNLISLKLNIIIIIISC